MVQRVAAAPRVAASAAAAPAFVAPTFPEPEAPAPAPRPPSIRAVPPAPPAVATEAHPVWRAIVERLPEDRFELRAFLARAAPLEAKAGSVVLAFGADEPFVPKVERELALVERLASEHFGVPTRVSIDKERAGSVATLAELDAEAEERERRAALAKVKNHPRVAEAVEVLGARVKDLKLAGQ